MPQGDKSSYSNKQKRKAEHIEDSYRKRGVSKNEAEERAWRTVNKQDGGAKKKRSASRTRSKSSTSRKRGGPRKRSSGRKSTARRRL
jgi:plasmid stabilization system protein ParE